MENTEKNSFITKFADFAAKLGNQIHLRTLRDAFATIMPLYILAGLAVLLNNTVFTWISPGKRWKHSSTGAICWSTEH